MTYFHASPVKFEGGDLAEAGHPPNFADEPSGFVFFTDTPEEAEWWQEFLGNIEIREDAPEEVFIYEVSPTEIGPLEIDDRPGTLGSAYQSRRPLRIVRVLPD